jgi:hypothetical protein
MAAFGLPYLTEGLTNRKTQAQLTLHALWLANNVKFSHTSETRSLVGKTHGTGQGGLF